ncbi:hypothetical protein SY86_05485 [Erwinia tracheiphila]|uniref:Uncharacterized protein n=1 Tax=Erwinia tracheiphila TaxID=65700 RepID=A0A0M2K7V0_9GAMM|nr:hypothetical protein SY86_05485 [Erwinia tracheiphila]
MEPELRALVFGQPHTRQFFLAFDVETRGKEHGFIDDATVLPDLQDDTVRVNDGTNGIQWPVLPSGDLLHDGISYL